MTRVLIGFFLGLMVAGAVAQTGNTITIGTCTELGSGCYLATPPTLNAGTDPNHNPAPIRVDANGYVICSTERP